MKNRAKGTRIVVFQEMTDDVRVRPQAHPRTGRVRRDRQVREVNPADARALDIALATRAGLEGASVVTLHLGAEGGEPLLREALARGSDEAIRIWDEECYDIEGPAKAAILAAAATAADFDLVLAGTGGTTTSGAQVGVLTAAELKVSCVTQAVGLDVLPTENAARVTRLPAGGFRETLEVDLPAVVTVAPVDRDLVVAPLPALLEARAGDIPVMSLAELGVPPERLRSARSALRRGLPQTPRPPVSPLSAPDPALEAFERIRLLVQGSVSRRGGRTVRGAPERLAEQLFEELREEGWLDHLRERNAE